MTLNIMQRLLNKSQKNRSKKEGGQTGRAPKARSLGFEPLEDRSLLSATPLATLDAGFELESATRRVVTTLTDVVDANDGVISLREALASANNGDTIAFASSLNNGRIRLSGEELVVTKSVTIDASALDSLTIDALSESRVFYLEANGITLKGLTITAGIAEMGGGVLIDGANASLIDCTILGNTCAAIGGGIYLQAPDATFTNCLIIGNTTKSKDVSGAGGVYVGEDRATFVNCTISNNTASWLAGGVGIDGDDCEMRNCVISGNKATGYTYDNNYNNGYAGQGGGAYVRLGANSKFVNCSFTNNIASGSSLVDGETVAGGGLYVQGANATISNCQFSSNQIEGDPNSDADSITLSGGGLYIDGENSTLNDCTISLNGMASSDENVVMLGGGLTAKNSRLINSALDSNYVSGSNQGWVATSGAGAVVESCELINCRIIGNVLMGNLSVGGGVAAENSTLIDCRIDENTVGGSYGAGGGVASVGSTLTRCVVYHNQAPMGGGAYLDGMSSMIDSHISVNDAFGSDYSDGVGGGVLIMLSGTEGGAYNREVLTQCEIVSNNAKDGGGLAVVGNDKTTCRATVSNCKISDNKSSDDSGKRVGGGAVVQSAEVQFINAEIVDNEVESLRRSGVVVYNANSTFVNSTISGNSVVNVPYGDFDLGGTGVYAYGDSCVAFYNSIIAQNKGSDLVLGEGATATAYNTLSGFSSWNYGSQNIVYNEALPLFNDASNGDYSLAWNSAAIDAGQNKYIQCSTDVSGAPRISGVTVDLGAREFHSQLPVPTVTSASATANSFTVKWRAVSNAQSYSLRYKLSSDSTWTTKSINKSETSYTVSGLASGSEYQYQIRAIGDGTHVTSSSFSTAQRIRLGGGGGGVAVMLSTPSLTVKSRSGGAITVGWDAVSGASGYTLLYKKSTDADYTTLNLGASVVSRKISISDASGSYYFKVRAVGDGTNYKSSGYCATVISKPSQPAVALATPSLTVNARTGTAITVGWDAVSGASGYTLLYKKSTDADYTTLNLGASVVSRKIPVSDASGSYYFKVRAVGDGVSYTTSGYCATVISKPAVALSTPSLTVKARSGGVITVGWDAVSGASGYTLLYRKSTDADYTTLNLGASVVSRKISGLDASGTYYFKVRAVGDGANYSTSGYCGTVTSKAQPAVALSTPSLEVKARTGTAITVGWDAVSGASGYTLLYKKSTDADYTTLNLGASVVSRKIPVSDASGAYYFKVRAVGDGVSYTTSDYCATVISKPAAALSTPSLTVKARTGTAITVGDRKSTRLNSSHRSLPRMPSSA